MMQIREAAEYLKENLQLCGTGRVKVATGLGRGHGIPVETGISCPLVSYHSLFRKGDSMRLVLSENKKNGKTSSAGYVYIEGHGWINIELFLDKIRKDVKRIEQKLGNTQKKQR